jgi:replicative DNA helicase
MSDTVLAPEITWSDEAEQNVLALVLMHPQAAAKLTTELRASDFYRPNHRRIFAAAQELLEDGRPVDPVILADHLRAEPWFQELDGSAYLHTLAGLSALVAHASEYGRIVHEYARKRETVLVGDALSAGRMAATEAAEILRDIAAQTSRSLPFVTALQLAREEDAELKPVVAGLLYRGS